MASQIGREAASRVKVRCCCCFLKFASICEQSRNFVVVKLIGDAINNNTFKNYERQEILFSRQSVGENCNGIKEFQF